MSKTADRTRWVLDGLRMLERGYPGGWWTRLQVMATLIFEPSMRALRTHLNLLEASGSIEVRHSGGKSPALYRVKINR